MSITTRRSRPTRQPVGSVPAGTNLVVVRGDLRADPEWRTSSAGDEVLQCDLLVRVAAGPAESVPVLWAAPPASAARLVADLDVVVVGRVRRRFFRVGGATATRTEVQADVIVPVRAAASVRRVIEGALGGFTDG